MGLLDDAIREHLELKRRHGASEEEVRREEAEALGPARREPGEPAAEASAPAAQPDVATAEDDLSGAEAGAEAPFDAEAATTVERGQAGGPERGPAGTIPAGDGPPAEPPGGAVEPPDEGAELPGEVAPPPPDLAVPEPAAPAHEQEPAAPGEEPAAPGEEPAAPEQEPAADEFEPALHPDADQPRGGEEDVLEETPEFLQETPEHDRLWFEQKPPRDFDFDD